MKNIFSYTNKEYTRLKKFLDLSHIEEEYDYILVGGLPSFLEGMGGISVDFNF